MKRLTILLVALAMLGVSCGKIQQARTALAFVTVGVNTCQVAFDTIKATKEAECKKTDPSGGEKYAACMKKTLEAYAVWEKLRPQLEQTLKLAKAAIDAAEAGKEADYVKPIKEGVCLLTKLATWLPDSWKQKVNVFLAMAQGFACDNPTATTLPPERQRLLLVKLHNLLTDMLGAPV